ncbi:MAG TPA: hypothetical protein VEH84_01660 [Alphaproteobacteria bacterium]|nr:hypothetical protein [Alphaproteobacteria bacterium]
MISFSEILLLAALGAAVWIGIKRARKLERDNLRHKRGHERAQARAAATGGRQRPWESARNITAEETVKCAVCGTYVPANGGAACGRADCPAPRQTAPA